MAISDWPSAERPRERLLAEGARALSDAELIAVLLRTGVRGKSAVDLARELIDRFGGYPREIVKAALAVNAAAVIFAHNHPSGAAQPSRADELLTRSLKESLALVEVKVLDHFIVAGNQAISFAERGLL